MEVKEEEEGVMEAAAAAAVAARGVQAGEQLDQFTSVDTLGEEKEVVVGEARAAEEGAMAVVNRRRRQTGHVISDNGDLTHPTILNYVPAFFEVFCISPI